MDTSQFEKLRPCGRLETYSTARHHLGFYNNVGLTTTYTTSSDRIIPIQDLVLSALHHVVAEHPNLSAIPVHEDKSYPDVYFARLPGFDLRRCVDFHTRNHPVSQNDSIDTELDQKLRQQHSLCFKSHVPGPYWRLIITTYPEDRQIFTASWIFHHALADGASAMIFHKTFLEGLNKFVRAPTNEVERLVRSPSIPLAPSLEDLHPMTTSWQFFLSAVVGSLLPSYFKRGPWTGGPIAQSPPQPGTIKSIGLSAENTRKFVAWCREQQTSVTAALSTLLALAIFQVVDPSDPQAGEVNIGVPISLRPVIDLAENQMLNAITNHTTTIRHGEFLNQNEDEDIGQLARRVKIELTREVDKRGADNPIALLKYVSNMQTFFTEKLGTKRETTAEVSNLGVYRARAHEPKEDTTTSTQSLELDNQADSWTIGRMVFSQSANHTGPLISLSAVTGGDGCLVMSFTWAVDPAEEHGKPNLNLIPGLMERFVLALVCEGIAKVGQIRDKQVIFALVAGRVIDEEIKEQEALNRAKADR